MKKQNDFEPVFLRLKQIFKPYARKMEVASDSPLCYLLNTKHIMKNKQPLCFGGVRQGKSYVSFYLMPVYASAELSDGISPALAKRRQGKSCFNFTTLDEPLFVELEGVAAKGIPGFRAEAEAIDAERSGTPRT